MQIIVICPSDTEWHNKNGIHTMSSEVTTQFRATIPTKPIPAVEVTRKLVILSKHKCIVITFAVPICHCYASINNYVSISFLSSWQR